MITWKAVWKGQSWKSVVTDCDLRWQSIKIRHNSVVEIILWNTSRNQKKTLFIDRKRDAIFKSKFPQFGGFVSFFLLMSQLKFAFFLSLAYFSVLVTHIEMFFCNLLFFLQLSGSIDYYHFFRWLLYSTLLNVYGLLYSHKDLTRHMIFCSKPVLHGFWFISAVEQVTTCHKAKCRNLHSLAKVHQLILLLQISGQNLFVCCFF